MLYVPVEADAPIRQGDLLVRVPRMEADFSALLTLDQEELVAENWLALQSGEPNNVQALVSVRPVTAIVLTQDCDAIRARDISLAEVLPFEEVEGQAKNVTSAKVMAKLLTRQARVNAKWFHMPADEKFSVPVRSAVDFRLTFSVPRSSLEDLVPACRVGRLNEYAYDHFRERVGNFFRRYAYDEWYTLPAEELGEYRKSAGDVPSFPWQEPGEETS